jgi:glycerophosphoryl diester phosphodiesterase
MGFLTFVGVALLLVLLVVAGIVVYCGRWRYPGPRRKPTGKYPVFSKFKMPLHISHRGGSESFPANTMVAYRGAVYQYGTSGIEIDLHLSADGEVVLMHDRFVIFLSSHAAVGHSLNSLYRTVESTTDGHGIVSDFSVAQLKCV